MAHGQKTHVDARFKALSGSAPMPLTLLLPLAERAAHLQSAKCRLTWEGAHSANGASAAGASAVMREKRRNDLDFREEKRNDDSRSGWLQVQRLRERVFLGRPLDVACARKRVNVCSFGHT